MKDDWLIRNAGNFSLINRHKLDETLTEYGDRKFEKQGIGDTAGKHSKTTGSTKLMHRELDTRRKL